MSPPGIRLHRLAERELEEAFEYYEEQSPGLGERFLTEAARAFLLILRHPRIAPVDRGEIRRFALATRVTYFYRQRQQMTRSGNKTLYGWEEASHGSFTDLQAEEGPVRVLVGQAKVLHSVSPRRSGGLESRRAEEIHRACVAARGGC